MTDQIQLAVAKGGFSLKGFTISGSDPPENLSSDGKSIHVLGLKWFPKGDFFQFNVGELNFARKERGRKPSTKVGEIPDNLTLKDCVSKMSEIFDPLGRIAPILAGMKLDASLLHKLCKDWTDFIPSELKPVWASHFIMTDEIGKLKYQRANVPMQSGKSRR